MARWWLAVAVLGLAVQASGQTEPVVVGVDPQGGMVVPTRQVVRPTGSVLEFPGRPVDLALSPDGKTLYVKDRDQLIVIDAAAWQVRQQLVYPPQRLPSPVNPQVLSPAKRGATMHGLAISGDGSRLFVSLVGERLGRGGRRIRRQALLGADHPTEHPWRQQQTR